MVWGSEHHRSWRPRVEFYRTAAEVGNGEPMASALLGKAVVEHANSGRLRPITLTRTGKGGAAVTQLRLPAKAAKEWVAALAAAQAKPAGKKPPKREPAHLAEGFLSLCTASFSGR